MADNGKNGNTGSGGFGSEMDDLIREMASRPGELEEMEEAAWVREKQKRDREEASKRNLDMMKMGMGNDELAGRLMQPGSQVPAEQEMELDVSSEEMIRMLCEQQGMDFVKLEDYSEKCGPDVLALIPSDVARMHKCLPIRLEEDGFLLVAIADPLNIQIVDDLHLLTGRQIRPVVASEDDIIEFVDIYYGVGENDLGQLVQDLEADESKEDGGILQSMEQETDLGTIEEQASKPPVIRLVNLLLMQAIKDRASDLHIEPFPTTLRIRYRVDGVLKEIPSPPKSLQVGLLSRFKVMANMNIAEQRRSQDGRIKLTLQGREIDLRVSTMPTVHGESMAMRVLDKGMMSIGINQLGMGKKTLARFRKLIKRPNGIILCTGPTGSGKTTSLYAAMSEINNPQDKIITTEDPVEYEMPGLVQVNINEKIGLTFEKCLRSILRQDPDIILVGEIRDLKTAQISVQASLTGHLVFSTLHTNSAAATVTRLLDMGIEPFLLTSTLKGVVGQRLVRTICPNCKVSYIPSDEELAQYTVTREDVADITFFHGEGCDECGYSGYKGRIGIYEMLEVDSTIIDLIHQRESQDVVHAAAVKAGMSTMNRDGWMKICMGMTTFEEVAANTPTESKELVEMEMNMLLKKKREADSPQVEGDSPIELDAIFDGDDDSGPALLE